MSKEIIEEDNMKILQEFMFDIECLKPLEKWSNKFNLFNVLKIARTEIRHSNMLAWLLDPNENHNLQDSMLNGLIRYVIGTMDEQSFAVGLLLMNLYTFQIRREWNNIDILAISEEEKCVICIENKIDSKEHDNQLNKYYNVINNQFEDYKKIFLYLTKNGDETYEEDETNWIPISYKNILEILENACNFENVNEDAKNLIDNYIEILRRDIVENEELEKICLQIYNKYQKALDLIYEYKPDKVQDVRNIFIDWAKNKTEEKEIELVEEKSTKTYTRFKTNAMSEILPDAKEKLSDWGTKNYYFYELYIDKDSDNNINYNIKFVLNSKNIPEDKLEICEEICKEYYNGKNKNREKWIWRTIKSWKCGKIKNTDEIDKDSISEILNKQLIEIKKFEKELKEKLM